MYTLRRMYALKSRVNLLVQKLQVNVFMKLRPDVDSCRSTSTCRDGISCKGALFEDIFHLKTKTVLSRFDEIEGYLI